MSSADNSTTCSDRDLRLSLSRNSSYDPPIHCLTRGESIGLAFNAEAGFISMIALLTVFALIARNIVRHVRRPPSGKWRLIQQPLDLYMLSLFIADLLQATATVIDVKWVEDGKLEQGGTCTAQGVLTQLGDTGVAMATLAIALQTFVTIWWGKGQHSLLLAYIIVGLIWLYNVLFVGIGIGVNHYETPTPYWCWIDSRHLGERLAGEYIWFWITLVASFLAYVPLYFWSAGNVTVNPDKWFDFKIHKSKKGADRVNVGMRRYRITMLAYPLVYVIIIIPLSVVRFITFRNPSADIPSSATFVVNFIYELSGFLDVLLFLFTRPNLLLFRPRSYTVAGRAPSPSPEHERDHSGLSLRSFHNRQSSASSDGLGVPTSTAPMGHLPDEEEGDWNPGLDAHAEVDQSSLSHGEEMRERPRLTAP